MTAQNRRHEVIDSRNGQYSVLPLHSNAPRARCLTRARGLPDRHAIMPLPATDIVSASLRSTLQAYANNLIVASSAGVFFGLCIRVDSRGGTSTLKSCKRCQRAILRRQPLIDALRETGPNPSCGNVRIGKIKRTCPTIVTYSFAAAAAICRLGLVGADLPAVVDAASGGTFT